MQPFNDQNSAEILRRLTTLESRVLVLEAFSAGDTIEVDVPMPRSPGRRFTVARSNKTPAKVRLWLTWESLYAEYESGGIVAAKVGLDVRLTEHLDQYEKDSYRVTNVTILGDEFVGKCMSQYRRSYDLGVMPAGATWVLEVAQTICPTSFYQAGR